MTSAYLHRPLLPLAVALPWMLEEIESELATAGLAETRRLRRRAELIRELLSQTEPIIELSAIPPLRGPSRSG